MSLVREQYLHAASSLMPLIDTDELRRRWDSPSALAGWTCRILAGHLTRVVTVPRYTLAAPEPEGPPVGQLGRELASGRNATAERAAEIHRNAAEHAAGVHADLVARYRHDLEVLTDLVRAQPADRLVLTKGTHVVALDDYLVGRALELLVHADDLAVSLDLQTPAFPDELTRRVLELLLGAAVSRSGSLRVLRAFTRREREDGDAMRVF